MSLSVNSITNTPAVISAGQKSNVKSVSFKANSQDEFDIVDISDKELSVEEKQKLIKRARTKAAGWAIFGSLGSTIYYATRSDKKVARKFNLDVEKDKDLIKRIKKEQTMWTLPGLIPGAGPIIGYLISANLNSSNIEID